MTNNMSDSMGNSMSNSMSSSKDEYDDQYAMENTLMAELYLVKRILRAKTGRAPRDLIERTLADLVTCMTNHYYNLDIPLLCSSYTMTIILTYPRQTCHIPLL